MVKISDLTFEKHLCTKNKQRGNHNETKQTINKVI